MSIGTKSIIAVAFIVAILVALIYAFKSKHPIKCFILTAIQGLGALCAVNLVGIITGITLSINYLTLSAGAIMGIPGVILILGLNIFLGN